MKLFISVMNFSRRYFAKFCGLCSVIGLVIMCFAPPNCYRIAGIVFFAICIVVGLVFSIFNFVIRRLSFTSSLLHHFETLKKDKKDAEIIRWWRGVRTPLWLSQKYEIRKTIGEKYAKDAAIRKYNDEQNEDDYKVLIRVLIDDIGWTYAELNKPEYYKKAYDNISEGINNANEKLEHDEFYKCMVAKGNRHLLSLKIRQKEVYKDEDKKKCDEYKNEALRITNQLKEGEMKNELLAEYYFAVATYEYAQNNFSEAKINIEQAEEYYNKLIHKNCETKFLARKGDILLNINRLEAYKLFIAGEDKARKKSINKDLVRNLIGLIKYYLTEEHINDSDKTTAQTKFREVKKIATEIGMFYELDIIKEQEHKLVDKKII